MNGTPASRKGRRPFPSAHVLGSWISEACQDKFFDERWNDRRDLAFPAFAAACLALAKLETRDQAARVALYRDIATKRRRMVLGDIAGFTVTLLAQTAYAAAPASDSADNPAYDVEAGGAERRAVGPSPPAARKPAKRASPAPTALRTRCTAQKPSQLCTSPNTSPMASATPGWKYAPDRGSRM